MARLTYAALALALAALVSGFFIRTTAIPLFVSIGLSGVVLILILRGWAKRVRQTGDLDDEDVRLEEVEDLDELEPMDIVVVEPGEETVEPVVPRPARAVTEREVRPRERPRPAARPRPRTAAPASGSVRVVVLPGRSRYHRPQCRFARGKGAKEIAVSTARRQNYQPCTVCLGG